MSVIVYWTMLENEWIRAKEPESLSKIFMSQHKTPTGIQGPTNCPAIHSGLKNIFALRSIYDYEFTVDQGRVYSTFNDEDFFLRHVTVRDVQDKMFSFSQRYAFFSEERDLQVTLQIPPYLDNDGFIKNYYSVPGKLNINKWFRGVDFAFYMRDNVNTFSINYDQIFSYIEFQTDKKIIFKKFMPSTKIFDIETSFSKYNHGKFLTHSKLEDVYSFSTKGLRRQLIKEIKENVV